MKTLKCRKCGKKIDTTLIRPCSDLCLDCRDIKFRAWLKKSKKMLRVLSLDFGKTGELRGALE